MDEETYRAALTFPDQSASFVHGFEAGELWARLKDASRIGATSFSQLIHAENEVLVANMARALGYRTTIAPVWSDESDADYSAWTNVLFEAPMHRDFAPSPPDATP